MKEILINIDETLAEFKDALIHKESSALDKAFNSGLEKGMQILSSKNDPKPEDEDDVALISKRRLIANIRSEQVQSNSVIVSSDDSAIRSSYMNRVVALELVVMTVLHAGAKRFVRENGAITDELVDREEVLKELTELRESTGDIFRPIVQEVIDNVRDS